MTCHPDGPGSGNCPFGPCVLALAALPDPAEACASRKKRHPSQAPLHGSGNSQKVGPDDPSSLSLSVMFFWLLPKACWRETERRDKKTKARLVMWRSVVMLLLMHHPPPCRQSAASFSIGDETRARPVRRRSTRWGKEIEGGIEAMLGKRCVTTWAADTRPRTSSEDLCDEDQPDGDESRAVVEGTLRSRPESWSQISSAFMNSVIFL